MVASRMERNFQRLGIHTIHDLAHYPKERLQRHFGIMGRVYRELANGRDDSPVSPDTFHEEIKNISNGMTLPYDYHDSWRITVIIRELVEEVCRRARAVQKAGRTVSLGIRYFDLDTGFYRSRSMDQVSNLADDIAQVAVQLFDKHWNGQPVRAVSVGLTNLTSDQLQLDLFHDKIRQRSLANTLDQVKDRFGMDAVIYAASLTTGLVQDRAAKIGGHYK